MKIRYSADQCGAGKTLWALNRLANTPGRYVLVVDRMEIADTRRAEIAARSNLAETIPHIEVIVSVGAKTRGGVGTRIAEAGHEISPNPHAVLIITHAGMTRVRDWSGFQDWDAIIIDEVPAICEREEHASTIWHAKALETFYGLRESHLDGVSDIHFKRGISNTAVPAEWRAFHDRVLTGEARCDLQSWSELEDRQDAWSSWRIWDVTKLDGVFREVTFLADGFRDTETAHLIALNPDVEFERFKVSPPRTWEDRPVSITYVSADRRAASTRFRSEDHAADMGKVWDWLAGVPDRNHLWTVNANVAVTADIPGKRVTPKQAGSNAYMDWHKASAIYAAKPSPSERKFYAALGIDPEVITASREAYDLNQFFMRTSLRVPDSIAPVELRCFDRHQAETFAAKLMTDYGITMVSTVFEDIGLELPAAKVGGRPPKSGTRAETPEERREAQKLAQRRSREKKKATRNA